jgi:hypothetical protein
LGLSPEVTFHWRDSSMRKRNEGMNKWTMIAVYPEKKTKSTEPSERREIYNIPVC